MRVERYSEVGVFYEEVEDYLLAREAEHNLMLGICSHLMAGSGFGEEAPYFTVVREGGEVSGAAVRTPPYNVVLSQMENVDAVGLIAEDAGEVFDAVPGVVASPKLAEAFARGWTARKGGRWLLNMEQLIYKLEAVKPTTGAAGKMRTADPADEDDRARLITWMTTFQVEALGENPERKRIERILERFKAGKPSHRGLVFWVVDGKPVSMAGYSGPTPNGIRVNAVYTPPEQRRKGYASACVAALSQRLLDDGHRFCFLYTDKSNPTSNRIYREIGYEVVGESVEITFKAKGK